jgi:hypothetical protein
LRADHSPGRRAVEPVASGYSSFTTAITMLASTQTTISACVQIQKGDMAREAR